MSAEAARRHVTEPLLAALRALLGDRVTTSRAVCEHHGKGEAYHAPHPPEAVAFAQTTEEVAEIVRICAANDTPVIAYGAGTSLEGHTLALDGGVTIDLSGLDRVLAVNEADLDCTVQAGVTRKQLNAHLRATGLFFPIDPGADASLGGMAATRASGTNAVRYGTMRENVLALTVVLADGRVIRTARRARKSSAGYDLTRLFVGSEGTLGIITEVTLRLYGIPEAMTSAVCAFPSLENAVNAVILTIQSGIPVARIELIDDIAMGAIIDYAGLEGYSRENTLFFEFHGTEASAREQAEMVEAISRDFGGADFKWATRPEDRNRLWEARHNSHYASLALRKPGQHMMATDVCVPISRLADCILETKRDIAESGFVCPLVGHVGDGNFHLGILADYNDPIEAKKAYDLHERLVMRALSMGGTCTGEHGVGYGKIDFLVAEHGEAVSVMRALKKALDPDNLLNPGKVLRV